MTTTIERVYTEKEMRDHRKKESLVHELYVLSDALADIECAENVPEHEFRAVEKLIEKRKAEIEQELLMLPSEPNDHE